MIVIIPAVAEGAVAQGNIDCQEFKGGDLITDRVVSQSDHRISPVSLSDVSGARYRAFCVSRKLSVQHPDSSVIQDRDTSQIDF